MALSFEAMRKQNVSKPILWKKVTPPLSCSIFKIVPRLCRDQPLSLGLGCSLPMDMNSALGEYQVSCPLFLPLSFFHLSLTHSRLSLSSSVPPAPPRRSSPVFWCLLFRDMLHSFDLRYHDRRTSSPPLSLDDRRINVCRVVLSPEQRILKDTKNKEKDYYENSQNWAIHPEDRSLYDLSIPPARPPCPPSVVVSVGVDVCR
jgi:hypothetical protein